MLQEDIYNASGILIDTEKQQGIWAIHQNIPQEKHHNCGVFQGGYSSGEFKWNKNCQK